MPRKRPARPRPAAAPPVASMRPGLYAPEKERAVGLGAVDAPASMRPGLYAPEKNAFASGQLLTLKASMRPGLYAPEKRAIFPLAMVAPPLLQ